MVNISNGMLDQMYAIRCHFLNYLLPFDENFPVFVTLPGSYYLACNVVVFSPLG